jgi:hypothetical protein
MHLGKRTTGDKTQKSSANVQGANEQNPGSFTRTLRVHPNTTRADDQQWLDRDKYAAVNEFMSSTDLLRLSARSLETPANSNFLLFFTQFRHSFNIRIRLIRCRLLLDKRTVPQHVLAESSAFIAFGRLSCVPRTEHKSDILHRWQSKTDPGRRRRRAKDFGGDYSGTD